MREESARPTVSLTCWRTALHSDAARRDPAVARHRQGLVHRSLVPLAWRPWSQHLDLPGPASVRIGGELGAQLAASLRLSRALVGISAKDNAAVAFGCVLLLAAFWRWLRERRLLRVAPLVGLLLGTRSSRCCSGALPFCTRACGVAAPLLLLALRPSRSQRASKRRLLFARRARGRLVRLFGVRLTAFRVEVDGYHALMRRLPAGLSMRPIIFDRESQVFPAVPAFIHYSAYYYVEKGGWQGYSFAMYPISVVRYRPHVTPGMQNAAEWQPNRFDPGYEVPAYQYFLVRSETDRSAQLFADAPVPVRLDARFGPWWGYVRDGVDLRQLGGGG